MLHPLRSIAVGVATPEETDPVLHHAAATARALGAALHVVHAFEPSVLVPGEGAEYAAELRARLEARARADAAGVETVCHVAAGPATECLPRVAREVGADLLVVGATRRNRVWRRFLGTTAEGVVRRAGVPVLVQRSPLAGGLRRVLLPTDLSGACAEVHEHGLDVVAALAGDEHPDLRSLLVVDEAPAPDGRVRLEGEALRELDAYVRMRRPRVRGVQCRVRTGDAAEQILAEASEWEAELVVLGTHGGDAAPRFHLGSTAGATLRGAVCNVLVVPPAEAVRAVPERPAGPVPAPLPAA
jgi:nucleotide-binding universal stress UspA family protein